MDNHKEIKAYNEFVVTLQALLNGSTSTPIEIWKERAIRCVDGQASEQLRKLISLETRRKYGAFFTDTIMTEKVLKHLRPKIAKQALIYDPACGAGNLLIGIQNLIYKHYSNFLEEIQLIGTDIHKEFVEASELRLLINSMLWQEQVKAKSSFCLSQLNGYKPNEYYEKATHIIVNPPFNLTKTEDEVIWSKGKISAAALFIDNIIKNIRSGVSIYAILPDVLRSGTRYEKWRNMINSTCKVEKIKLLGQFDKYTDVDVFAISLTKRLNNFYIKSEEVITNRRQTIDDLFDVSVGPVVDYRDPFIGKSLPYIVSRGLERWAVVKKVNNTRKHSGKSFKGPFVVIKRTSRMSDSKRATATIINTRKQVFVDNHLIILKPKSGTFGDCERILEILKDSRTDDWINNQIRCRHLTVKIVSKIPIWQ